MSKIDELKDGWGGDVLTSDRYVDTTTSEQSGDTFCYELDFDVFTDDGRYERWIDLYPEVSIRRCESAGTGSYIFVAPGEGDVFGRFQLPVGFGGLPDVRIPDIEDDEDYIPLSITIAIYDFEFGITDPLGYINSLIKTVNFSEIFQTHDGDPFMADSYTIRYQTSYTFGNAPLHSLVASVHPRREVEFLDLEPTISPLDDYTWFNYRGQSLTVSGTGGHHVLERDTAGEYAGHGSGPVGFLTGLLARGGRGRGLRYFPGLAQVGGRGRVINRAILRSLPYSLGGIFGAAHVGTNYLNASSGYLIGNVLVTPEGGERPATIQIAVGVNLEEEANDGN